METLHPSTDGNGRLGRLIVVLQLIEAKVLRHRLISLSPLVRDHPDADLDEVRARLVAAGQPANWPSSLHAVSAAGRWVDFGGRVRGVGGGLSWCRVLVATGG